MIGFETMKTVYLFHLLFEEYIRDQTATVNKFFVAQQPTHKWIGEKEGERYSQ